MRQLKDARKVELRGDRVHEESGLILGRGNCKSLEATTGTGMSVVGDFSSVRRTSFERRSRALLLRSFRNNAIFDFILEGKCFLNSFLVDE